MVQSIYNLGRPICSVNHSGASDATVFTIRLHFPHTERVTQSETQVGSSLLDALTVPSTHHVHKIVFIFSPIFRGCTSSIVIYLITMEDLISSQHRLPATICHFFVVIRLLHNGPRYTDPGTQIPAQ